MQESHLKQTALLLSLLGLIILYFYAQETNLKPTAESLNQLPPASKITFLGTITNLEHTNKGTFLTLEAQRPETVDIIVFHPESLYLKLGQQIQVQGNVEEYNGKTEIIAQKIVLLSSGSSE